jgi:hypothetical protein
MGMDGESAIHLVDAFRHANQTQPPPLFVFVASNPTPSSRTSSSSSPAGALQNAFDHCTSLHCVELPEPRDINT